MFGGAVLTRFRPRNGQQMLIMAPVVSAKGV